MKIKPQPTRKFGLLPLPQIRSSSGLNILTPEQALLAQKRNDACSPFQATAPRKIDRADGRLHQVVEPAQGHPLGSTRTQRRNTRRTTARRSARKALYQEVELLFRPQGEPGFWQIPSRGQQSVIGRTPMPLARPARLSWEQVLLTVPENVRSIVPKNEHWDAPLKPVSPKAGKPGHRVSFQQAPPTPVTVELGSEGKREEPTQQAPSLEPVGELSPATPETQELGNQREGQLSKPSPWAPIPSKPEQRVSFQQAPAKAATQGLANRVSYMAPTKAATSELATEIVTHLLQADLQVNNDIIAIYRSNLEDAHQRADTMAKEVGEYRERFSQSAAKIAEQAFRLSTLANQLSSCQSENVLIKSEVERLRFQFSAHLRSSEVVRAQIYEESSYFKNRCHELESKCQKLQYQLDYNVDSFDHMERITALSNLTEREDALKKQALGLMDQQRRYQEYFQQRADEARTLHISFTDIMQGLSATNKSAQNIQNALSLLILDLRDTVTEKIVSTATEVFTASENNSNTRLTQMLASTANSNELMVAGVFNDFLKLLKPGAYLDVEPLSIQGTVAKPGDVIPVDDKQLTLDEFKSKLSGSFQSPSRLLELVGQPDSKTLLPALSVEVKEENPLQVAAASEEPSLLPALGVEVKEEQTPSLPTPSDCPYCFKFLEQDSNGIYCPHCGWEQPKEELQNDSSSSYEDEEEQPQDEDEETDPYPPAGMGGRFHETFGNQEEDDDQDYDPSKFF